MQIIFQLLGKIQLKNFNKNETNKSKATIVKSRINYKDPKNSSPKIIPKE